jgi:hypothetical protein
MQTLLEQLEYIMKNFDFEYVVQSMKKLDWKWGNTEPPSIEQLKDSARNNLNTLIKDASEADHSTLRIIQSGGFQSQIINGEFLKLSFVLTDAEGEEMSESENDCIYPFYWNGREWHEEDCDDVFVAFYTSKLALRYNGSVYIGDGVSVFPDGTMNDE